MKDKKGFTLVELLAVIVLLSLLSTIGITMLLSSRKNANIRLAKKLEQSLTDIGEQYYIYETTVNKNSEDESYDGKNFYNKYRELETNEAIIISLKQLKDAGYLKGLKCSNGTCEFQSPSKGTCPGYLLITNETDGPTFKGYIKCDVYETTDFDDKKVPGPEESSEIEEPSETEESYEMEESSEGTE